MPNARPHAMQHEHRGLTWLIIGDGFDFEALADNQRWLASPESVDLAAWR